MNSSELSGNTLAYLGDAVLSLMVRKYLISLGLTKSKHLQENSIKFVSAKGQAAFIDILLEENSLSEKELEIYKRGRNHKSDTIPKNTDVITYRKATGLEALWGYWYLIEEHNRLEELFQKWTNLVEIELRRKEG